MNIARSLLNFVMASAAPSVKAEMQVSVTEIADQFYDNFATEESGRYWWWVQMVLLDPNELIVNNGDDKLFRVPFTLSGNGVTFGEAKEVQIQYIDVAARADAVAAACTGIASVRGTEKVAARFGNRAESRPQMKGGGSVDLNQLRETLGLPADTPESEVYRVAAERLASAAEEEPETPAAPAPGEGDGGQDGTPEPSPATPPATPQPAPVEPEAEGPVLVDAETLRGLREDAEAGRTAFDTQQAEQEELVLSSAIQHGKFPPSRKDHYAKLMKADREGTVALIESLEENVVPLKARGVQPEDNDGQGSQGGQAYPPQWLPEVQAKKAAVAARAGASPRIMSDGV